MRLMARIKKAKDTKLYVETVDDTGKKRRYSATIGKRLSFLNAKKQLNSLTSVKGTVTKMSLVYLSQKQERKKK